MNARDAVKQIKSVKPDRLLVHDRDGQPVTVVLATLGRHRWQRLEEMLDTRAWTRVECFTAKGDLLREVQAEGAPARDREEVVEVDAVSEVERLTAIMLKVQTQAMGVQSSQIDRALAAFEKMAAIMSDAMITVRDSYDMALKLQAAALTQASGGEDAGMDGSMMQLMQMALALKGGGFGPFGAKPAAPPPPRPKTTTPPAGAGTSAKPA